jgi:DNA replication factor GINS
VYNELYKAWKVEISNCELGSLPPDFYSKINAYLSKIKEDNKLLDKKSLKIILLEHEKQHVNQMLEELLKLRYEKLMVAITEAQKIPVASLASEEAKLCENFLVFSSAYQKFAKSLLLGESPQTPPATTSTAVSAGSAVDASSPKRVALRFSKNVPAVIGFDMKPYGPFKAEDVASLPVENAKMLIKQGLAVQVDLAAP